VRTLYVLKEDRLVGELRADDARPSRYTFVYQAKAVEADFVSLTMPPSADTVWGPRATLHPIFDMNLPEGERRVYLERAARVAAADEFTLLQAIGARQIGLLRFVTDPFDPRPKITPLKSERLKNIQHGLEFFESVFSDLAASSGISGVQPKVLAATEPEDAAFAQPLPGTLIAETHILKRDREAYLGMVISEHLCAQALKRAGLAVPTSELSADGKLLVLERFDRAGDVALHFEEFCSLMGLTSIDKYDTTYERLVQSVQTFIAPESRQTSVVALFRALVAYRLIGNADAHLKNFGVLCTSFADIRLAPFYDAVCTRAFESTPPSITMVGRATWWSREVLARFGRYCGLGLEETEHHINEVCSAVEATLADVDIARHRYPHFAEVGERMHLLWNHALQEIREGRRHTPPALKYPKRKKRIRIIGATS
jgi:serine/threonine-protein kinase HipA